MSHKTNLREEIFQLVSDETFLGVLVFTLPDNRCEYLNKFAREYLALPTDFSPSDLRLADFYPDSGRERFRPFSQEFLGSEGLSQDVIVRRKDKSNFIADIGVKILRAEGEEHLLLMIRDVTLQKKMQRDLTAKQTEIQSAYGEMLQQNIALKALDRAKDKFIALTTHELRTPLSAMIATAEVLALKLYDTDEERDGFINTIYQEGLHLLEIVNDILDFSKIQAGKMDFFVSEQDVKPVIEKLMHHFENMAAKKGVKIVGDFNTETAMAYIDGLRIKQAFSNVLNNAIKFTGDNTTVTVSLKMVGDELLLGVHDQGPGIAPESIDKVFNEFETVGNVNTHHKGTGLGMPISKKIMDSMGGKIALSSVPGQGACFTLHLPCKKVLADEFYRTRPSESDDLAA